MGRNTAGYRATITPRDVGIAVAIAAVLALVMSARDDTPDSGPTAAAPIVELVEPVRLTIPSIDVAATVQPSGIDESGAIEVPPLDEPQIVGWYDQGSSPGQPGAAVLLGHLTTPERGVFYDLDSLDEGDRIEVSRADGSVAIFAVDQVFSTTKSEFPVAEVYGPADGAVLRLVTCGGDVDDDTLEYEGNVIVYASLAEWRDATP